MLGCVGKEFGIEGPLSCAFWGAAHCCLEMLYGGHLERFYTLLWFFCLNINHLNQKWLLGSEHDFLQERTLC